MSGKPGRRWKNPKPCGSDAAYKRHLYHREVPCDPCHAAHRAYDDEAEYRRQLRAVQRQTRIEADLRELIAALAAAFTTPPDKAEYAESVHGRPEDEEAA